MLCTKSEKNQILRFECAMVETHIHVLWAESIRKTSMCSWLPSFQAIKEGSAGVRIGRSGQEVGFGEWCETTFQKRIFSPLDFASVLSVCTLNSTGCNNGTNRSRAIRFFSSVKDLFPTKHHAIIPKMSNDFGNVHPQPPFPHNAAVTT